MSQYCRKDGCDKKVYRSDKDYCENCRKSEELKQKIQDKEYDLDDLKSELKILYGLLEGV